MRVVAYTLSLTYVFSSAVASPVSTLRTSDVVRKRQTQAVVGKAAYIITNDGKQNAVAAIAINADGTLGDATLTSTGGSGSIAVDAKGQPAVPDALVGQSSLTIAGNNIFAVNAGSNSVSMLAISPNDPLSLKLVGQPASIPGTFPNTVAASKKNSLVCVGTTGSKAGISCANFDARQGIGPMDDLRAFDLGQSDPPVGPTNTVSQAFFSADESMLFTTVKGDPAVNKTGFLSVFPVENGQGSLEAHKSRKGKGKGGNQDANAKACESQVQTGAAGTGNSLSRQETRSSPAGTAVLFGSQSIPGVNNKIFATDASFGAAVLVVDNTLQATVVGNQTIDGQKATCWATISDITRTAFVTDVGVNRLVEMSLEDAAIVGQIDLSQEEASAQDPGLIDLKAAGGFVYALSPGNGTSAAAISVIDARTKQLIQHAQLDGIGVGATAQGMAVLI